MKKLVSRMLTVGAVGALFAVAAPAPAAHAATALNPIVYCHNLAECDYDSCVGQKTPYTPADLVTFPALPVCSLSGEPNVSILKALLCGIRAAQDGAKCLSHFQAPGGGSH